MTINEQFTEMVDSLTITNMEEIQSSISEITRKLNKSYYGITNDYDSHMYLVGSMGRKTAIKGNSDIDIIFDFPMELFDKYDGYSGNGQSSLLQDVKNTLLERYTKTTIRGDGQVVVIAFDKYTIELVPGFKQSDDSFKYPDTHNGGSWKTTNPLDEQKACNTKTLITSDRYLKICKSIRQWKNNDGIEFPGILIDTLVFNAFTDNNNYYSDFTLYEVFKKVLKYISNLNTKQSYWFAMGSNQQVYNTKDGAFIKDAKSFREDIDACDTDSEEKRVLSNHFGNAYFSASERGKNEAFIEEMFPIDIRYELRINCKVTQNGFRDLLLRSELTNKYFFLPKAKSLEFFVEKTSCPLPFTVYWKVRNVGESAIRRNCIRGNIVKDAGSMKKREHTDFNGPHYVECFLVKNGVCVARNRINVPIKE